MLPIYIIFVYQIFIFPFESNLEEVEKEVEQEVEIININTVINVEISA